MVHHPSFYADLLKRKILKHGVTCWLVNTGWIGGPFGIGKRISIGHTRALLNAALTGELQKAKFVKDPVFGFEVPRAARACLPMCLTRPVHGLVKINTIRNTNSWHRGFIENFKKFEEGCPPQDTSCGHPSSNFLKFSIKRDASCLYF